MHGVELIAAKERTEGTRTAGMIREEAIADDRMWAGLVRTPGGMTSAWHHHADYETAVYVVTGAVRIEFGPQGREAVQATQGDFLRIPPHAVHREINPLDQEADVVVVRAGSGTAVVNLDGPTENGMVD